MWLGWHGTLDIDDDEDEAPPVKTVFPPPPPPQPEPEPPAPQSMRTMSADERKLLQAARERAINAYPGPVGKLVARTIADWEDFGYRFHPAGEINALINDVMRKGR